MAITRFPDRVYADLDERLSSTINRVLPGAISTAFLEHPICKLFMDAPDDGVRATGQGVEFYLQLGKNATIKSRDVSKRPGITAGEKLTKGFQKWGTVTGSISIDRDTLLQNQGPSQLIDLVDLLVKQAGDSLADNLAWQICQGNTGRADTTNGLYVEDDEERILGLRDMVSGLGDTSKVGIQAAYVQYPNTIYSLAPQSALTRFNYWHSRTLSVSENGGVSSLPALFRKMDYTLSNNKGGKKARWTDLLTSQVVAEYYAEITQSAQRFVEGGSTRDVTGDFRYTCMGNPITYDPYLATPLTADATTGWTGTIDNQSLISSVPGQRAFMVNRRDLRTIEHPQANIDNAIEDNWRLVDGGFDKYKLLLVRMQCLSPARQNHGLLYNIALVSS